MNIDQDRLPPGPDGLIALATHVAGRHPPDIAATAVALDALRDQALIDANAFDLAPVSLWLEDYSDLRAHFSRWRAAGVQCLETYLADDPRRISECLTHLRVLKVNQVTVELFGGDSQESFVGPITPIFDESSMPGLAHEFVELWQGKTRFSLQSVNCNRDGRYIDVAVTGIILPGYEESWARVLIAVQDVTEREAARRHARGLFNHSPIALWVQDYSGVKYLIEQVRRSGITNFENFLDLNEEFLSQCLDEIRIVDVNEASLNLFRAPDQQTLCSKLREMNDDRKNSGFTEELIDLWNGKLQQQRELTRYTLDGEELYLYVQLSVFPGHEKDWSMMLTSLTDITARRQAESYLEYLGNHDELTKLHNRFFFNDYLKRLQRAGQFPVTIIMIDLNGLKRVNDENGHGAGDALLRRIGEVLLKAIEAPCYACRIGGDEFAVLLPAADETDAAALLEQLNALIQINNQFHSTEAPLRISAGTATALIAEQLDQTIRLADTRMYEAKNKYYEAANLDRRR